MAQDGFVGLAYNRLRDAFARGYGDRLYLVSYEKLCSDPFYVLSGIYKFLDAPLFVHNPDKIEQTVKEDDAAYGFPGLHDIKTKLEPAASRWHDVLGEEAEPLGRLNEFIQARLPG